MNVDSLRWKRFQVLDKGEVCLVDVMGDDSAIAQAARVSYGKGTKKVSDDRSLIRYLIRHRHTSPLEMCEIKLRVRVPMDCWRQWIRHRTANVNEYSTRYSIAIDDTYKAQGWRAQSTNNKQGSSGFVSPEVSTKLSAEEEALHKHAKQVYDARIKEGVAREQARKDLPLSTYTEAYWKIDLHNMLHFLSLRMDSHAQQEIREYATTIGYHIIKPLFPIVWEAFEDYRLHGMFLTRLDIETIHGMLGDNKSFDDAQPEEWKNKDKCRERHELVDKMIALGIL